MTKIESTIENLKADLQRQVDSLQGTDTALEAVKDRLDTLCKEVGENKEALQERIDLVKVD